MSRHILKADALWFDRVADGSKTAELRKHDRDFQIGDTLVLVRIPPDSWGITINGPKPLVVEATISHILPASVYPDGLQIGYSMLSLANVSPTRDWTEGDKP